jgi:hypothetical protein
MRPHKKLEVWIKAVEFVTKIYRVTESFPDNEKFGLIVLPQLEKECSAVIINS